MKTKIDKAKLLALIDVEYAFWERTLALLSPELMQAPNVVGFWSVKDVVANLTAWERRLMRWLDAAQRGEKPQIPEPGFSLSDADVDTINAQDYAHDKDLPLADALSALRSVHGQLRAMLELLPEADFFEHDHQGAFSRPPWRLIAGNTYEHFAEHSEQVRAWMMQHVPATQEG